MLVRESLKTVTDYSEVLNEGGWGGERDSENINIILWNPKATSQQAADALREIADFVAGGAGRGGEGK